MFADSFDLLVFDLDGTLADTQRDLAESVNFALASVSRPPLDHALVPKYVGDGALRLIERSLGTTPDADADLAKRVLVTFIEHYRENCAIHTVLYPDVRETLETLRSKRMTVLTNKPSAMAKKILADLKIEDYFAEVLGGDSVDKKKPDPSALLGMIEDAGAAPARTLMIGDSANDIRTARAASAVAVGVTYGFRPDEFRTDPPDYVFDSLRELLSAELHHRQPKI